MVRLLICYDKDPPSANMRHFLLEKRQWEDIGSDGDNTYMSYDGNVLMSISQKHINAEGIDDIARRYGVKVDDIVFMSRHSAASGKPTLTVHPIGNYKDAEFGGRPRTLVPPTPHLMTDALRRMKARNDTTEYSVSFEVTHHGPYVEAPTMFIEIGSEETHWGDMHAADMLSDVLLTMEKDAGYPVVIGVGGGHYAPRFTDLALSKKVDFGHMVPAYQTTEASDDEVARMIGDAARSTDTKLVYVHRKSMKGAEERRLNGIIDSLGLERISSDDFESM